MRLNDSLLLLLLLLMLPCLQCQFGILFQPTCTRWKLYLEVVCMQQQLNRNRTVSLVTFNLTKWWTKLTKAYATENEDEKNFVPIVVTYRPTYSYTHLHAVSQFRWKYTDKFRTFNAALYSCCCLFACTIFRFSFSETSNTCSFDPNNEVIKSKQNCSAMDSKVKPICYV